MKLSTQNAFLKNRIEWGSEYRFVMVTAAAVIGIGNFWVFPQLLHRFGVGFLIAYLIALFLVGVPAMVAEMVAGRHARQNQVDGLFSLALEFGRSTRWQWLGVLGAITLILILSTYILIAAMPLGALFHAGHAQALSVLMANPMRLFIWCVILVALASIFVGIGIQHGLERISILTIFSIFMVLFVLIGLAWRQHVLMHGIKSLLTWHAGAFSMAGLLAALSYSFFSLSVGCGTMFVYGSYLPQRASLTRAIGWVVFLEVFSSLLISIALSPWLVSHMGSSTNELMIFFQAIPATFSNIAHISVYAFFLYLVLFLAAFTSLIAMMEPLVIILIERFEFSRFAATLLLGCVMVLMATVGILSLTVWQPVSVLHQHLFQFLTNLASDILLPVGGIGFAVMAGRIMSKKASYLELNGDSYPVIYHIWRSLIRWVAPLGIVIILVTNLFF